MRKTEDQKPKIFKDLITQYVNQLIPVEGCSPNTAKSYKDCYAILFLYMKEVYNTDNDKVTFAMLTQPVLTGFLDWMENTRKCTVSTRNQRRAALSAFGKYASKINYRAAGCFYSEINKIPKKRGEQRKISYFTLEELKVLLSLHELHTLSGRRDSVLLITMYFLGTRSQEICDLKVGDIEFLENGLSRITIHGKGNKTRILPFPETVTKKLKDYLAYEGILRSKKSFVFKSQNNPQMSISCVEEIFKKYIKKARTENPEMFSNKGYTPHSMRHTTAVHMLEAGVSLPKIQRFLGHASIATTQIYAEITQKSLDKSLKDWNAKMWGHLEGYAENEENSNTTLVEDQNSKKHSSRPDFLR